MSFNVELPDNKKQEFALDFLTEGGNKVSQPDDVTMEFVSSDESIAKVTQTEDAQGAKHLWFETGGLGGVTMEIKATRADGTTITGDNGVISVGASQVGGATVRLVGEPVSDLPEGQTPVEPTEPNPPA